MQLAFTNKKLKKNFCCSADNIYNLNVTTTRPSALTNAEKMTIDINRLISHYYIKTCKFGNISRFVCDFVEGHNGMVYFL